jgi:hypothetical protein
MKVPKLVPSETTTITPLAAQMELWTLATTVLFAAGMVMLAVVRVNALWPGAPGMLTGGQEFIIKG